MTEAAWIAAASLAVGLVIQIGTLAFAWGRFSTRIEHVEVQAVKDADVAKAALKELKDEVAAKMAAATAAADSNKVRLDAAIESVKEAIRAGLKEISDNQTRESRQVAKDMQEINIKLAELSAAAGIKKEKA